MVDTRKLRSRMVLMGFTQKDLVAEMNAHGLKTSENTLCAKLNGRSQFNCEDADVICSILNIQNPSEKADIFLAPASRFRDI